MTMTTLGITEDSKEGELGKEKEDQDEDSSPHYKIKGKGKRKGKSHLAGDESYWTHAEWQRHESRNWNEAYWTYEDETARQSQH